MMLFKLVPKRWQLLAFAALSMLSLNACSAMLPEGINPNANLKSADATGTFPAVGVTPAPPAQNLTAVERDKLIRELETARSSNAIAAGTPLNKQVQ